MSSENEISVITGTMVSNLVDEEKYGVYPVYLNTDGEMFADQAPQGRFLLFRSLFPEKSGAGADCGRQTVSTQGKPP